MTLNKVMLIGNLTRDPEIRNTTTGKTVASFGVATSMVWKDQSGAKQEKAEFHNIVAWGKLAEICGQYLKKGLKVYIEGRLQTRDWTGQDGVKRYRTEIVAENMIMLSPKSSSYSGGQSGGNYAPRAAAPAMGNEQPFVPSEPIIDIDSPAAGGNDGAPEEEEIRVENIPF
ncbi:MAG TPA: single-stranded DNA-binding protein [Candidatus Nanoarchaeia archaeon]|nr:single-stranded DNA-binding protein [Candidatus Nanoarchaeia archaeon]